MVDFNFLKELSGVHILVAGEVGIDEYIWGDTRRISPEAPVPIVEVESQTIKLGLSANVAQNIDSLGAKSTLVTVRGDDEDGERLETMISDAGIKRVTCLIDPSRPTLRKMRVISNKQHVVRVDYEKSHVLDARLAKTFNEKMCDEIPNCDGIIVQDYGKGIFIPDTMAFVRQARDHKKPIFVDPSRNTPLSLYRNTTLLTPNLIEAETLLGIPSLPSRIAGKDDARLLAMGKKILEVTEAEHAVITCGENGMISVSRGSENTLQRIPTFARDVFDVTGAGDTVVSIMALVMAIGLPLARCMQIANAAAGIVVGRIGASSVSPKELKEELERLHQIGLIQ